MAKFYLPIPDGQERWEELNVLLNGLDAFFAGQYSRETCYQLTTDNPVLVKLFGSLVAADEPTIELTPESTIMPDKTCPSCGKASTTGKMCRSCAKAKPAKVEIVDAMVELAKTSPVVTPINGSTPVQIVSDEDRPADLIRQIRSGHGLKGRKL